MIITKEMKWHMGHYLPNHDGACRNAHGHTYRIEVSVGGKVRSEEGEPDEGMVVDFSVVKDLMKKFIHKPYDHAFMVHREETDFIEFAEKKKWKVAVVPFVPTAENMVVYIAAHLEQELLMMKEDLYIARIRLWETDTSYAEWVPKKASEQFQKDTLKKD